jgi:hypothetical protein
VLREKVSARIMARTVNQRQSHRRHLEAEWVVTGHGNRWTRERVTSLRSHHRIAVYKPAEDGMEPWHNLGKAARLLHVAPKTLRLAAEAGEIEALRPLPDAHGFSTVLSTSPARAPPELLVACESQLSRPTTKSSGSRCRQSWSRKRSSLANGKSITDGVRNGSLG